MRNNLSLRKRMLASILAGIIAMSSLSGTAFAEELLEEDSIGTEVVTSETAEETTTELPTTEISSAPAETTLTTASETEAIDTTTQSETIVSELETLPEEELLVGASETDPVAAFVTRLYTVCLNRNPDSVGLQNWTNQLRKKQITAVGVATGILNSSEYQGKKLSDEAYISNLYQVFLNRSGSQTEVQNWLKVYQQGVSKDYLIRGFSSSSEFTALCNSYGVERGSVTLTEARDKAPKISAMVVNSYRSLNRTPSGSEINQWVSKLQSGLTGAALAQNVFQSSEYQGKKTSDETYISNLYQTFLGRSCSSSEIQSWIQKLNQGVSRTYLMAQFCASGEYTNLCKAAGVNRGSITLTEKRDQYPGVAKMVVNCYQILGRTASGTEIESWVKKTVTTGSGTDLVNGFFNSQEYLGKNKSNTDYVTDLYLAILTRNPDSAGLSNWVSALNNGTSRESVRNFILSSSEFQNRCAENGIKVKSVKYPKAVAVLNQVGWNLKSAFQWSAGLTYYGHNAYMPQTADPGTEWYADYGFTNKKGNCYVMAATFCEMARELGYDAKQISGSVPLRSGGYGPHSWVEISINGTTYVFDPDFTNETGRNGYQITYGQSGTWKYNRGSVMQ